MNEIISNYEEGMFDSIKHTSKNGNEYWEARELMPLLDYKEWRKFEGAINKAKETCKNSKNKVNDHFVGAAKMITIAKGGKRKVNDYKLSRYACYLIAQNGDSRKKAIALAQTYFAIQTRRMEIIDKDYDDMSDDEKRLFERELTRKGNRLLNRTAAKAGVRNFQKFHNAGYRGLYNGETADDIAKRKGLRYREEILDYMELEELSANLFRITQTESKIRREGIKGDIDCSETHYDMGKKVRKFIEKQGGTMPENLPTPKRSIKDLEKDNNTNIELKKSSN